MTLSDIEEFRAQAAECTSKEQLSALLEDAGEDYKPSQLDTLWERCQSGSLDGAFLYSEENVKFNGLTAKCTKCGNTSPNILLASAVEVLSTAKTLHFGCCECGTQFTLSQ